MENLIQPDALLLLLLLLLPPPLPSVSTLRLGLA